MPNFITITTTLANLDIEDNASLSYMVMAMMAFAAFIAVTSSFFSQRNNREGYRALPIGPKMP